MTSIELLSPAKDLACGIAAIDHGADAVYIGAMRFGARSAAGNSILDISALCNYAHRFNAKVYVTVNTIFFDDELEDTRSLIWELYTVGVDALIVQDMALLKMDLPPIPLHASTQMDNRSPEQVKWLSQLGFRQVVVARELSVNKISDIHQQVPDVSLEAFVHGALCVSYSGQCYVSQYCFGRSANRGECAQFCRLRFSLEDSEGKSIIKNKYLLSLRDMNRTDGLEEMIDAGVRSFKIEGRLKDISYVKNVTAWYRQHLDEIFRRRHEYKRASLGTETITFSPDPLKSFSRGFTDYFLHDKRGIISSSDTPKRMGNCVGYVKEIRRDCLIVAGTTPFANGDGLCFLDENGNLQGFRVNRVDGNHLYPERMPEISKHIQLYRNYDQQWERILARQSSTRSVHASWSIDETSNGFLLTFVREDGKIHEKEFVYPHAPARTDQSQSIIDTLKRVGNTIYTIDEVKINFTQHWFIPRSVLAEWRRLVCIEFPYERKHVRMNVDIKATAPLAPRLSYLSNVSNRLAREFYCHHGCNHVDPAMEISTTKVSDGSALMFCRHCLRHELGWCIKDHRSRLPYREPLYLVSQNGRRFRLKFDCANCQMIVYAT